MRDWGSKKAMQGQGCGEGKELVLLDTDIGSDIDDSFCLAYLLREPRCRLLGITTVTGDTRKRASCCDALCQAAGRFDIPIHPGASEVLLNGPGQPDVPRFAGIEGRYPYRTEWPEYTAIEFLRRTIRAYPGQVTLLGIGPLTNIALLLMADPEICGLLKRLVIMCGVFRTGFGHGPGSREWNALVDPVATAVVYRARIAEHRSIGLDVTKQCRLSVDEVRSWLEKDSLKTLKDMASVHLEDPVTFHDPLAAVSIFDPEVCNYASGVVRVETSSPILAGLTTLEQDGEPRHQVAISVDSKRFFERFFSVFQN